MLAAIFDFQQKYQKATTFEPNIIVTQTPLINVCIIERNILFYWQAFMCQYLVYTDSSMYIREKMFNLNTTRYCIHLSAQYWCT